MEAVIFTCYGNFAYKGDYDMKLIKQVLYDVAKEIGWITFYGILTAMVAMAFVLVGLSYQYVVSRDGAISNFEEHDISMVRLMDAQFNVTSRETQVVEKEAASEDLNEYFSEVFSDMGNAGTFVIMPECCGYRQVIILLGIYAELTPFREKQTDAVTFAVSEDMKDVKLEKIVMDQIEYPLYVVPADMEVYHPMFYLGGKLGTLENTLFVFSHDFNAIRKIFPDSEYGWGLHEDLFFDRFIFERASEWDIARLRMIVKQNIDGKYVSIQNVEDFLKNSVDGGTRTHRIYLLFYVIASLSLFGAMILNIHNVLKRKIPEYAVHRMFGASESFIFARMFLFVLLYHVIPLGGVVRIMSLNQMLTPMTVFMIVTIAFAMLFVNVVFSFRQFRERFSQGYTVKE